MATVEDWNQLKVTDLKTELKQRGLSTAGRKEELVQRLTDHEQGTSTGPNAPADGQADANGAEAEADTEMGEDVQQTTTAADAADATVTAEPAAAAAAAAAAPAETAPEPSAENRPADATQDPPPVASAPSPTPVAAAVADPEPIQEEQKRKHDSPPPMSMDIDDGEPASFKRQKVDEERTEERTEEPAPAVGDMDIDMADKAGDGFVEDTVGVSSSAPAAIHPRTNALYIANLMRPLRPMLLDRCMADLAGSKDAVTESFLDPIKTHAFVVFANADAAARVRDKLHGTVWPDERTRRPLWIDFVPSDSIRGWIDEEKADRGFFNNTGRNGGGVNARFDAVKRWEIVYSSARDAADGAVGEGQVVTTLRQIGSDTPEITGTILFDASMLPGSSNQRGGSPPPFDAPRGPRGKEGGGGPGMVAEAPRDQQQQQRQRRGRGGDGGVLEDEVRTTRSSPPLDYQVVHPDLVQRRLTNIRSHRLDPHAKGGAGRRRSRSRSRDPRGGPTQSEYTKTHNRYSFEGGFELVDRGPEQFDGIRPPHRERERRQQRARGGGGGGGGPRFGVGGGVGGGSGGPPTGPSAGSGPGFGGRRRRHRGGRDGRRPGYDDYRPSRGGSRDRSGRGDGGRRDEPRDWRDDRRERKERDGGGGGGGGSGGGRDEREGRLGGYDERW